MEDELKSAMSAESGESTVIQLKEMRIAHLKAFLTPIIGYTGMQTSIIQLTAKRIAQPTMNPI
jgi:hypothetical protein